MKTKKKNYRMAFPVCEFYKLLIKNVEKINECEDNKEEFYTFFITSHVLLEFRNPRTSYRSTGIRMVFHLKIHFF